MRDTGTTITTTYPLVGEHWRLRKQWPDGRKINRLQPIDRRRSP